jgi:hypothetical protein
MPIPPSHATYGQAIDSSKEEFRISTATRFFQFYKQEGVTVYRVIWNELDKAFKVPRSRDLTYQRERLSQSLDKRSLQSIGRQPFQTTCITSSMNALAPCT